MFNLIRAGKVVEVGDVVRCLANEPWVFTRILDFDNVEVMWEENLYVMPTLALGCKVVKSIRLDS